MHKQVIECNTEVAMETLASTKFENKYKMADSCFPISNQRNVEQLKESSKNQNTLKATYIDLVESMAEMGDRTDVNQKIEEYEHEKLDKTLHVFYWPKCEQKIA